MSTHTYRCPTHGSWQHEHDGPGRPRPQKCPRCKTGHTHLPTDHPVEPIPEWMKPPARRAL